MTLKKYYLNDYKNILIEAGLLVESHFTDEDNEQVQHLAYHSDEVEAGTLFFCKSTDFKKEFLEQAVQNGAIGYIAEQKYEINESVSYLIVSDIRLTMALIAEYFYNSPQEKLTLIGIGGTKGKTTTTYFIKAILDEYLKAQEKPPAGLLSTIATFDGYEEEASVNTTPEAIDLQRHLANAVAAGLEYVVMEVSSQSLKYHRTAQLKFDIGIFLNIDEDHISPTEHVDFEDYLTSKAKMFEQTKQLLINNETNEREYLLNKAKDAERFWTFSVETVDADYYASALMSSGVSSQFHVSSNRIDDEYELSMPGDFNVENALAAIAAADLLGIPQTYVKKALKEVHVPGRMGIYITNDKKVVAVSDYAHNRLSFESLIQTMKKSYPNYKIISVFGAPGGKALGRREELGTVGGRYSDYAILTMDDPNFEEVEVISAEIAKYVEKEGTPYEIVLDRKAAIKKAFQLAKEKTIILAIGKGHEKTIKIEGRDVPIKSDDEIMLELVADYDTK